MKGIILPTFMVIIISYYIDPYQSTKYSGMSAKGPRVLNVAMSNEKNTIILPHYVDDFHIHRPLSGSLLNNRYHGSAVRVLFVALMTSADLPWPWPADPARPTKAIRWHNATGAQGGQKFSLRKIRKDGPQKPLREMG